MSEITCPHCNEQVIIDGQFCKFCGGDLENEIIKIKQKQLPIRYKTADEQTKSTKKEPLPLLVIVSSVVCTILVICMFILMNVFDMYDIWVYIILGVSGLGMIISGFFFRRYFVDKRKSWYKFNECISCSGCCEC